MDNLQTHKRESTNPNGRNMGLHTNGSCKSSREQMAQTLKYSHATGHQTCKKKQDVVIYIAQNNIEADIIKDWPGNDGHRREKKSIENKLVLRPLVRQMKKKINVSMLKP